MNVHTRRLTIAGPAGPIEIALDAPGEATPRGLALVAHPHPQFGGSLENKVAQTLARAFVALGYLTVRPNFRGVGKTAGSFDQGMGETEDLLAVIAWMRAEHPELADRPLALGGFSFGSFVVSRVARRLAEAGMPAERLVLVGTAATRWTVEPVPADTIVIHGELDDTIPLADVFAWARPQELPVVVIPGADHFFHRRLPLIKSVILRMWDASPLL